MRISADEQWAKYIFQTFLNIYLIEYSGELTLSYGKDIDKNAIVFFKGEKCDKNIIFNRNNIPIFHSNDEKKLKGTILASYEDGNPSISYDRKTNKIFVNSDIIKTSFLLLSRAEEENTPKDEFGRFQVKYSMNKNVTIPIVNQYFELLFELITIITNNDNKNFNNKNVWPNGAPYAVCLTHDVDTIYKWWLKKILSYSIKKRKIKEMLNSVGKNEYCNFQKIMDLEDKYGFRSTFFFLTNKRDIKPRYNIKKFKKVIKNLDENGWEIGLHTGLNSYNDKNKIYKEKHKIEQVTNKNMYGLRNHYLRFIAPDTWQIQEETKFIYDSTLGFHEAIGFRSGFCHPFMPYDFKNNNPINILELSMTFMDNTIFLYDNPLKTFDELINIVKKYKGLIVVNWHQKTFNDKDFFGYTDLYEKILQKIKRDEAFVTTCKDITQYWNNRRMECP